MNIRFQGINEILWNLREGSIATIDAQKFPNHRNTFNGIAEGRLAAAMDDPEIDVFARLVPQLLEESIKNPAKASVGSVAHIWKNYPSNGIEDYLKRGSFLKFSELLEQAALKYGKPGAQAIIDALKPKLP